MNRYLQSIACYLIVAAAAQYSTIIVEAVTPSPTRKPTPSPTSKPTMPTVGILQFQYVPASELVSNLISTSGDIEIQSIVSSSHITECAALYTQGHMLGNLFKKGPNNELLKDAFGNYVPSDPPMPLIPDQGIILSSGKPADLNWNNADDITTSFTNAGGDVDLKRSVDESNGKSNAVYDACVLQFQFRCTSEAYVPVASFRYSFGSEEYYEYVDSAFNDVFGFYLNGENIAKLPSTDTNSTIVSINNVNYKDNKKYFHGNDPGTGWEEDAPDAPDMGVVYPTIEADGFTDTLTAYGEPYSNSDTWNTIKLAVGDVGDRLLDSWVVLEKASFTCVDITAAPSVSLSPSVAQSYQPSISSEPSWQPSFEPSISSMPSYHPSQSPSLSSAPSEYPSAKPTRAPTGKPTANPTRMPTSLPTSTPTSLPTQRPTTSTPSSKPSAVPTRNPTSVPTSTPTAVPTRIPTSVPTSTPTAVPTRIPTSVPTSTPTSLPTQRPTTSTPSSSPTSAPTRIPTSVPTSTPTRVPTSLPTSIPTANPTSKPTTSKPTSIPTSVPTSVPTSSPTKLSSIGPNTVFNDVNKDGNQDDGEDPLVGVVVSLICNGTEVDVQTTGVDGSYEFMDVLPGSCHINVTPEIDGNNNYVFSPIVPDGNQIFPNGTSPSITVGYNSNLNGWDVGMYLPPATIGPNQVFHDTDGDGNHDVNEPYLENITVDLYCYQEDGTAVLVSTTVTDINGKYLINDVLPGACYIEVTPPVGEQYVFSPIVPTGNQIYPNGTSPVVNINWNDVVNNWNVGVYKPVNIGDKVWEDLNGNGVQDVGEQGLVGVLVTLVNKNGTSVATTSTDAKGSYGFKNLPPGDYAVKFELPPDYEFSPESIVEMQSTSSNVGITSIQSLASGVTDNSFDVGMYVPVEVGGVVFDDKNANGIRDEGEAALAGAVVTVTNTDTGVSVVAISSSTKGPDYGTYLLSLPPGEYKAVIMPPYPEYLLSPLSNPTVANGNDFDPKTFAALPVQLTSGQSGAGSFDAGFYSPVQVEGTVWDDVNANGIRDAGEGGYTGPVTINLYPSTNSTSPSKSVKLNVANGSFKLDDVTPGVYEVEFVLPTGTGVSFTLQDAGNDDSKDSDVNSTTGRAPVTVVSGQDITNISAGVTTLPSIGPNQVFEDDDGDGVFDKGEKGLPNVGVTLYDPTGKVIAVTVTNDAGTYSFANLKPGDYYIAVNKDPNFEWSPVVDGGNQISPVANVAYENKSPTVSLGPGENDRTLLVGMYEPVTVGNKVWNDMNGDGVQQTSEPGMNGVTAMLFNGLGVQINTTKTDANGNYLFSDIKPGNYSVKFLLPDSFMFTVQAKDSVVIVDPSQPDNSFHYNDVTSDADRKTGQTAVKTLKSGEENYSFDAGMFVPITVNGTTWHDLDADGIEEDNEPGLAGVKVTLYDRDGDAVQNTTSGSDGVWAFIEMPPGTYHVKITPPKDSSGTEYQLSPKPVNQTGTDVDPKTWMTTPTTFKGGSSSDGLFDAGLYLPASIGDRIWFDDTPNGVQDGDEDPFDQPVTIKLYDSLGYLVNQTTSNVDDGSYQFKNVRPGTYSLEFILPEEDYKFTLLNAGNDTSADSDVSPTTGRATATVTSGEKKTDIDAGVMDFGPYYPDWTNDIQVCTNDGFDPAWLEIQEKNYLYRNKEECCKNHFWWRMTQCMANEEFKFYQNGQICDTKIHFEDWESNSPAAWTDTTQFDTVEECCANEFWFDYDGCVNRSPVTFKFDFCIEIKGLVDPPDCQSADIYANVLEDAINSGGLSSMLNSTSEDTAVDANITKIGDATLTKVDGSTVCGGSLTGGFINNNTGTLPDIEAAANKVAKICGVFTVEETVCKEEACLREHYQSITNTLGQFINNGDLTASINLRATTRLPPVPELQAVSAASSSLSTKNLLLPATVTGDLQLGYYLGSDLGTCMEKAVFQDFEEKYDKLIDCCTAHFQWDLAGCCAKGGGC